MPCQCFLMTSSYHISTKVGIYRGKLSIRLSVNFQRIFRYCTTAQETLIIPGGLQNFKIIIYRYIFKQSILLSIARWESFNGFFIDATLTDE